MRTFPTEATWTGTFTRWEDDGAFVTTGGEAIELMVWGLDDPRADVPDLAAAGEVTVTQQGECGWGIDTAVHVAGPSGDTLLLAGTIEAVDLAGWTIEAPPDTESCPGRASDGCYEWVHERPTWFTHGADVVALEQSETGELGGYHLQVNLSMSASGEVYCSDVGNELTSYLVVGPG
jgi:hypothetical protein